MEGRGRRTFAVEEGAQPPDLVVLALDLEFRGGKEGRDVPLQDADALVGRVGLRGRWKRGVGGK
jgi:hypothetical protein